MKRYSLFWLMVLPMALCGCHVHLHVGEQHYYGQEDKQPTITVEVPTNEEPG